MERREFLLTCAATAAAPIAAPAQYWPHRFTQREGSAIIFISHVCCLHVRFDASTITITNTVQSNDPAWTRLAFIGNQWTEIVHQGRRPHSESARVHRQETRGDCTGVFLSEGYAIRADFLYNLKALPFAMRITEYEEPEWWQDNPAMILFQETIASAVRARRALVYRIPCFVNA